MDTRILRDGIYFGEGPRWHAGRLWFSDFYAHAVMSLGVDGDLRIECTLDDQPSGLGWLPDGRLLVVAMHGRQVLRLDPGGLVTHADLSGVATWHANDMVVDADGGAWVGNFGFDLDRAVAERGVEGVLADHPTAALARVSPDGQVSVAATQMHFPNGSVITPDGRTLIVAETLAMRLTAFDIGPGGTLSGRRTWAELGACAPDGICLDADGCVWVANAIGAECLRVAEGGRVLQRVATSQSCIACALGGSNGRTLYLLTAPGTGAAELRDVPLGRIEHVEVATPGVAAG